MTQKHPSWEEHVLPSTKVLVILNVFYPHPDVTNPQEKAMEKKISETEPF